MVLAASQRRDCCLIESSLRCSGSKAAELFQKAADQGLAAARTNLGWMYYNGTGVTKDLSKAVELYQKAADQGEAYAQRNLGLMYQHGIGVPKDLSKAAELYRKAVNGGNEQARENLRRLTGTPTF